MVCENDVVENFGGFLNFFFGVFCFKSYVYVFRYVVYFGYVCVFMYVFEFVFNGVDVSVWLIIDDLLERLFDDV